MSNMSYCRFRNTLTDLIDCENQLEALFACDVTDGDGPLSAIELEAAHDLIARCISIVELLGNRISGADLDLREVEENFAELLNTANADAQREYDELHHELHS
jgi:hypothetical protein